jgi:hypothetical protein
MGAALAAGVAFGDTAEQVFERGNAAYEKGRYEEAAEAYRTVLRYGVRDPRVEYNLGCAAFKIGRIGEAVLHLEKAARLDPGDPDIQANLALARSRTLDRVDAPEVAAPLRWLRALQDRIGPDRHALAVTALVWAIAGLVAWCSARPGGWNAIAGWILVSLTLAAVLLSVSWAISHERVEGAPLAVVLEPAVEVLAGPGPNNATLFTVHEGLTLEIRAERQDWVQVSLPNGLNGWVPRDALGFV